MIDRIKFMERLIAYGRACRDKGYWDAAGDVDEIREAIESENAPFRQLMSLVEPHLTPAPASADWVEGPQL